VRAIAPGGADSRRWMVMGSVRARLGGCGSYGEAPLSAVPRTRLMGISYRDPAAATATDRADGAQVEIATPIRP